MCQLVEIITHSEIGYNEDPSHVAFMHQNVNFALAELRKSYPNFPGAATHGRFFALLFSFCCSMVY